MTIKFAKRLAAEITGRGESSIRVTPSAIEDVKKAMTRDDVRNLLKNGSIVAIKAKKNVSVNAQILKIRRQKGRGRGPGHRKGTRKARQGELWIKKSRAQRTLLKELRTRGKIDKQTFNKYYMLIKGNSFAHKAALLLHLNEEGIKVSPEELNAINEQIRSQYKAAQAKR